VSLLTALLFPNGPIISGIPEPFSLLGNDLAGTVRAQHVMKMMMTFMMMTKLTLLPLAMKLRVKQSQTGRGGSPGCRLILVVKRIVRMSH